MGRQMQQNADNFLLYCLENLLRPLLILYSSVFPTSIRLGKEKQMLNQLF
jgi:hypothetical protein